MITFKCPHCGKDVSVADEHAGKKGRCPGCKEVFQIPAGSTAVAPVLLDPAPADEEPRQRGRDEDEEDEAPRKKKRPRDEDEDIVAAPRKKRRPREDEEDRPTRRRRARDDYDEEEYDEEADFPKVVTAAGIAWIGFGSLILVGTVIMVLVTFVLTAGGPKGGPQAGAAIGGMACASLLGGLFGAAFIFVGAQSVRGTARDTLGNGIGSIIFGVIYLGVAAVQMGMENILQAGIGFLAGLGLVAAGVLALVGRRQYRAWKRSQSPRRRGRDRRYY